ncbi:(2Fe-2S)-binding protein [Kordiimonas sediminis]|uniref:(2Fe-2S)-binding protein n=1 Tax=Kordiimonas sediminis TaxID=1735581 RepID=A0A919E788_9PROT|nr:(2Fe-2S)-binding protein [Kordiimonas sediminis]GHF19318.1 (2Fe-2S)-binding protein [Kordiimonas sediminis]
MQITINGTNVTVNETDDTPLLWFLRDHQGLKGTKFGCGIGSCGACTIHVNGDAVRSCSIPLDALSDGDQITTIEGLGEETNLHPVQQAWLELDVPQCGYCQAGQIMAAVDLLKQFPNPTNDIIDAHHDNLCRCGTYIRIRKAIHRAAELLQTTEATS